MRLHSFYLGFTRSSLNLPPAGLYNKHNEIIADTEKEKVLLESIEKETKNVEATLEVDTETSEKQISEMKSQLEQLRALIKETKEITEALKAIETKSQPQTD